MGNCALTLKQQELLRSLVPGLQAQDGTVPTEWRLNIFPGNKIFVPDLNTDLWNKSWANIAEREDLDAFVECGFFNQIGEHSYKLLPNKIIAAVQNNFRLDVMEWAEQLAKWWDAGEIEQLFYLVDVTAANDRGIQVAGGLGYPSHLPTPPLPVVRELAQKGLLQVSETRGSRGGRQWEILLPSELKSIIGQPAQSLRTTLESPSNPDYVIDVTKNEIFGSPQESEQHRIDVFVAIPFKSPFIDIYNDYIKPTLEELSYTIKLGNDFVTKRAIMSDVWTAIVNAKLIIADCTGTNANVFYELGMAHTLNKSVIMLAQDIEKDIPFDIRHLRVIKYDDTPDGRMKLRSDLEDAIKKMLELHPMETLRILEAHYGAKEIDKWNQGKKKDVTDIVKAHVKDNKLNLEVSNDIFDGDPASGDRKVLKISYSYKGNSYSDEVDEDRPLRLPRVE